MMNKYFKIINKLYLKMNVLVIQSLIKHKKQTLLIYLNYQMHLSRQFNLKKNYMIGVLKHLLLLHSINLLKPTFQ